MVTIEYNGKTSLVDAKSLDVLMNYSGDYSNPLVIFDSGEHTNVSLADANKLLLESGMRPEIMTSSGNIRLNVNSINKIELNKDGTCNVYVDCGQNFLINDTEIYKILKALSESEGHGPDYGYHDGLREVPGSDGWLYDIEYSGVDYDYAYKYFSNRMNGTVLGACTSVWKNSGNINVFGHAYDWTYNDLVNFRVRTKCGDGYKGTMGMVSSLPWFTKEAVQSHTNMVEYKLIPFYMVDGINECHVWMSTNQVPTNDKGRTTGTNPDAADSVCNMMVLRYVLDRAESADDAKEILQNINIYAPNTANGGIMDIELHWMFGDAQKAYLLEIINNELVFTELSNDIHHMTNFFLDTENANPTLDPDGKCDYNNITPYGQGLERFDNIVDHYSEIDTASKMNTVLLQQAKYTDCYNIANNRLTDFTGDWSSIGEGYLTVQDAKSDPPKFTNVLQYEVSLYNDRTRDDYKEGKITSQSVHTVGYDIAKLRMYVSVQEQAQQYIFDFDNYYTKSEVDKLVEGGGGGGGTYTPGPGIIINDRVISLDNTVSNLTNYYTKTNTYDKNTTDTLLEEKADKATTLDGYGITDAVKTVNMITPISGNVNVTTFSAVPASMDPYKSGTLENFCKQFLTLVNPSQGSAYLTGGIAFTNLPKSFRDYGSPSCEMYIYVPVRSGNNVVFNLEITSTNCFDEQWYGGPGKWMAICQVENGSATLHMPWRGVMVCPQSDELIEGKHRYIPTKDSDGASKYYVDTQDATKQDILVNRGTGQNIKTINGQDILGQGNIEIQGGGGVPKEYVDENFTTYVYVDGNFQTASEAQNNVKVILGAPTLDESWLKPFNTSKDYVLNEYFLSETGYLLRFTEPHSAGQPLDPSSYVQTSLLQDLSYILTGHSLIIG